MRAIIKGGLVGVLGTAALVSCSSSKDTGATADGGAPAQVFSLDNCMDSMDSIYADPGPLPDEHGYIIKCAKDADVSAADLLKGAPGHTGKAYTSGAHVYRVLYRTERGDDANTPGTSSALVFIPITPRATTLPVIVSSHGTVGQAPNCTPSKHASDNYYLAGPLVGAGFAVIAPDLAGYANYGAAGNAPNAYADTKDVGKSTLDGARAMRKLMGSTASDQVVIVGHSQGGGTALGALALADTYGSGGTLAAVVAYAPLWLNQASWGALSLEAEMFPFSTSAFTNAVGVWYMYTHGELLDGPGHGGDIFQASKRAGVKKFVDTACNADVTAQLTALGTNIKDLYDPAFSSSVAGPVGLGIDCNATDATCAKWVARFAADRPHITGDLAKIPILLPYGGMDTTIDPTRMACVLDRLDSDKASYQLCYQPATDHTGVVNITSDYASDWIAARTLGAAEPAACASVFKRPTCATPPPND